MGYPGALIYQITPEGIPKMLYDLDSGQPG